MFFASLSLGLVLLPLAAAQQIHDVQVGGADGSLKFSPEAIVRNILVLKLAYTHFGCDPLECTSRRSSCLPLVSMQFTSLMYQVPKMSLSTASKRTTPSRKAPSLAHAALRMVASTRATCPSLRM